MSLPLRPSTELVALAWIASIPGLSADMVDTVLPPVEDWGTDGFVVVTGGVGGTAMDVPVKKPVVQLDCYAAAPGSSSPPWPRVDLLCEHIRAECYQRSRAVRVLQLQVQGVTYPPARVMNARVLPEPRRGYGDPADWAHKVMDLELLWAEVEAVYS